MYHEEIAVKWLYRSKCLGKIGFGRLKKPNEGTCSGSVVCGTSEQWLASVLIAVCGNEQLSGNTMETPPGI